MAYWGAKSKIMAASEERWFFSKQSTIGNPKLKPFRQRPKKSTQFDAIIHERSTIQAMPL